MATIKATLTLMILIIALTTTSHGQDMCSVKSDVSGAHARYPIYDACMTILKHKLIDNSTYVLRLISDLECSCSLKGNITFHVESDTPCSMLSNVSTDSIIDVSYANCSNVTTSDWKHIDIMFTLSGNGSIDCGREAARMGPSTNITSYKGLYELLPHNEDREHCLCNLSVHDEASRLVVYAQRKCAYLRMTCLSVNCTNDYGHGRYVIDKRAEVTLQPSRCVDVNMYRRIYYAFVGNVTLMCDPVQSVTDTDTQLGWIIGLILGICAALGVGLLIGWFSNKRISNQKHDGSSVSCRRVVDPQAADNNYVIESEESSQENNQSNKRDTALLHTYASIYLESVDSSPDTVPHTDDQSSLAGPNSSHEDSNNRSMDTEDIHSGSRRGRIKQLDSEEADAPVSRDLVKDATSDDVTMNENPGYENFKEEQGDKLNDSVMVGNSNYEAFKEEPDGKRSDSVMVDNPGYQSFGE